MVDLDKMFAEMADTSTEDSACDFVIDEDLRVIAVPERGVVLGVEGDKDVNRIRFRMNKTWRGNDMSKFELRVNYENANGDKNYYTVTSKRTEGDTVVFDWIVAADAVAYRGDVFFIVVGLITTGGTVTCAFHTTLGRAKCLEGLDVGTKTDVPEIRDFMATLKAEVQAYGQTYVNAAASSASAAKASQTAAAGAASAAKTSETNSAASAKAAKTSETNAGTSASAAKTSETNASASAASAKSDAAKAESFKSAAETASTNAAASKNAAADSAAAAKKDAQTASAAATTATGAASAAKTSETNAGTSASNAKNSETKSGEYLQATKDCYEQVSTVTNGARGFYETPDALTSAVPVGENGWWAVVGTTDSIWIWSSDTGAWRDSMVTVDMSDYYTHTQVDEKLKDKAFKTADDLNAMINALSTSTATPTDADYFVSQAAGGGTATTTYHRRPMSALWAYIKSKAENVFAAKSHTHSYAGSASAGGSATSAVKLDTPTAGTATKPVYFSGGNPVACTYELKKTVPADAVFTDHTYAAMKGATASAAGTAGLVPAPPAGANTKYLRGDGTYQTVSMLDAFPVGIVISMVGSTSPASLFGGTWEEIASDRVLMGASDTHRAGSTAEAGLPNITGDSWLRPDKGAISENGCFYITGAQIRNPTVYSGGNSMDANSKQCTVGFNASKSNAIYGASSTVQPAAYYVHIWERVGYLLNIFGEVGSLLTITDGVTTVKGTVDASGRYSRELPNTGTWRVTAAKNGTVRTESCTVSTYGVFTVDFITIKTFGVVWDYCSSSTALARLSKENDPHHFVTVNVTAEPSPAVGPSSGRSLFDAYAPWSGMEEYNIVNNSVSAKRGESGFSRANDTMVYIPEFYYNIVDDAANKKRYFYIAGKERSGFKKHPGSGRYVGRYNTAAGYASKTGLAPLTGITRAAARTGSTNKGSGWFEYDYASWCAICLLYIVEYADWNSQSKIGQGYVSGSSAIISGGTDSMIYHTGRAAGTDGGTAMQYRHIENIWGNVFDWVDGVNFYGEDVYVCTTPSGFKDDTQTGYTRTGAKVQGTGYISGLGMSSKLPWAFYPTAVDGSNSTYVPDNANYAGGWRALGTGGTFSNGTSAGLFAFGTGGSSSYSDKYIGARLLFVPNA